jgi:hypothetical protein
MIVAAARERYDLALRKWIEADRELRGAGEALERAQAELRTCGGRSE